MSRLAPVLVLALALAASGCSLSLGAASDGGPVNTCSGASDCAQDAVCLQNRCVATRYDLTGLLLEVHLRADATVGAGTDYVIDPSGSVALQSASPAGQPFDAPFDIPLPPPISIKGARVSLDDTTLLGSGCNFPDRTVPAQVTFYRLPRFAGLPSDPVKVTTTQVGTPMTGPSYAFDVDLVSGKDDLYDVYIEPDLGTSCATSIPPYYLPGQIITQKRGVWPLPKIGRLKANITGLTDANITSWQVDLLEPSRGLPISSGNQVSYIPGDDFSTVTAQISTIDPSAWPVLRLTPVDPNQPDPKPIDPTRPTVYYSLQVGVVGGTKDSPEVDFGVNDLVVKPVPVQGLILGTDGFTGVPSRLTILSANLQGSNGSNASYSTDSVLTDSAGVFQLSLPPGKYQMRAFPVTDSALSITDYCLPAGLSAPDCMGAPFQLQPKATVASTVTTPTGQPLLAATVGVAPSTVVAVSPSQVMASSKSYLYDTHNLRPLPVRVESTMTDGSGGFSLLADLGTCDLTVQPDGTSNLPWLVAPGLSPEPGAAPLPPMALPSPAFLHGTVLDPQGQPVANADVVAWFPVRDAVTPTVRTGTVVKIATTTTDSNGAYRLVLPSSIAPRGSVAAP